MRVDLARSLAIQSELANARRHAAISRKRKKRRAARREVRRLVREWPRVDERLDPEKALAGAVRYLRSPSAASAAATWRSPRTTWGSATCGR